MATTNEGKANPGAPFRAPPARIWNNMVDAGRAFADGQLNNPPQPPIRSRETDIIRIKNSSEALRRKGEILKIEGKAIETVSDESIWLLGVEPTDDCYFGILKEPSEIDAVTPLQVSGSCMALVTIGSEEHTRATVEDGEFVLISSTDGPVEILYAPSGTGEKECVIRFAGGGGIGPPKIRFTILSTSFTVGFGALGCDHVIVLVNHVSCSATGVSVGDELDVYDPEYCHFNLPIELLVGLSGTATLMDASSYQEGLDYALECLEEIRAARCIWMVDNLFCAEEESIGE